MTLSNTRIFKTPQRHERDNRQPWNPLTVRTGTTGFLLGGTAGIVKSTTPFLFASASGLQSFALGTVFWGTRTTICKAWISEGRTATPGDLTKASAAAGGITGGLMGLLMRGRSNVLPGALMFSLFGFAGQAAYNSFTARTATAPKESKPGFWRRMSDKSWSPITVMTDEQYVDLLKEKMLKVDVEIAIVDDRIAALRKEQQAIEGNQAAETSEMKS